MAFLSVASAATSAPLNPAYRASEFDFYLSDLDAKALLVLRRRRVAGGRRRARSPNPRHPDHSFRRRTRRSLYPGGEAGSTLRLRRPRPAG